MRAAFNTRVSELLASGDNEALGTLLQVAVEQQMYSSRWRRSINPQMFTDVKQDAMTRFLEKMRGGSTEEPFLELRRACNTAMKSEQRSTAKLPKNASDLANRDGKVWAFNGCADESVVIPFVDMLRNGLNEAEYTAVSGAIDMLPHAQRPMLREYYLSEQPMQTDKRARTALENNELHKCRNHVHTTLLDAEPELMEDGLEAKLRAIESMRRQERRTGRT